MTSAKVGSISCTCSHENACGAHKPSSIALAQATLNSNARYISTSAGCLQILSRHTCACCWGACNCASRFCSMLGSTGPSMPAAAGTAGAGSALVAGWCGAALLTGDATCSNDLTSTSSLLHSCVKCHAFCLQACSTPRLTHSAFARNAPCIQRGC